MGKLIPIVVVSEHQNGSQYKNYSTPVVKYVNDEDLKIHGPIAANGLTEVIEYKLGGRQFNYLTPIKPDDIEVLRNPTTTDYGLLSRKSIAAAANGGTNATTTILKQYTEITTATVSSADACKLPVNPVVNDVCCLVNNHATVSLEVFPGIGDFINDLAVDTLLLVAPGERKFFVCTSADHWRVATDYGR